MLLLMLACFFLPDADTGQVGTDDAAATDGGQQQSGGCEELEFGYDGPDPPSVGDTWRVWPICDNALGTSMLVLIDPIEHASVSDDKVTFVMSGAVKVTLRYGSQRVEKDIEVAEAP